MSKRPHGAYRYTGSPIPGSQFSKAPSIRPRRIRPLTKSIAPRTILSRPMRERQQTFFADDRHVSHTDAIQNVSTDRCSSPDSISIRYCEDPTCPNEPGMSTMVVVGSSMIAGPAIRAPGQRSSPR